MCSPCGAKNALISVAFPSEDSCTEGEFYHLTNINTLKHKTVDQGCDLSIM